MGPPGRDRHEISRPGRSGAKLCLLMLPRWGLVTREAPQSTDKEPLRFCKRRRRGRQRMTARPPVVGLRAASSCARVDSVSGRSLHFGTDDARSRFSSRVAGRLPRGLAAGRMLTAGARGGLLSSQGKNRGWQEPLDLKSTRTHGTIRRPLGRRTAQFRPEVQRNIADGSSRVRAVAAPPKTASPERPRGGSTFSGRKRSARPLPPTSFRLSDVAARRAAARGAAFERGRPRTAAARTPPAGRPRPDGW
jgi:hypothetical protein